MAQPQGMSLHAADASIIRKVLASKAFQLLIGAEEWDLTEAEEITLWEIIKEQTQ